jgi:hypothetical protein
MYYVEAATIMPSNCIIKKYCSVLTKVIIKAKQLHYNNMILRAKNKMKTRLPGKL